MDNKSADLQSLFKQRNRWLACIEAAEQGCKETGIKEIELSRRQAAWASAKEELKKVVDQINDSTITVEKLWRELIEIFDSFPIMSVDAKAAVGFSEVDIQQVFARALRCGHAMEIVDGDSLVCHGDFMMGVFKQLRHLCARPGVRTISIIGPQSSGKSTLANALWGADFATSA
eukprot:651773-Amphidinium_carterae.1